MKKRKEKTGVAACHRFCLFDAGKKKSKLKKRIDSRLAGGGRGGGGEEEERR